MEEHPNKFIEERLRHKYSSAFHFFLIKEMDEILTNAPVHRVAHFKDHLFWDDESEYMRRTYNKKECVIRI